MQLRRTRQKPIFPCVGGKPERWQPKPPPSKVVGLKWTARTRQHPPGPATTRHLSLEQGRGKKGVTRHFTINKNKAGHTSTRGTQQNNIFYR